MERLTERKDVHIVVARAAAGATLMDAVFQLPSILERLAAYEDTGLTPEEIERLKADRVQRVEAAEEPKRDCATCRHNTGQVSEHCRGCIDVTTTANYKNWSRRGPQKPEQEQAPADQNGGEHADNPVLAPVQGRSKRNEQQKGVQTRRHRYCERY